MNYNMYNPYNYYCPLMSQNAGYQSVRYPVYTQKAPIVNPMPILPNQMMMNADVDCELSEPFPGNGELYKAPPDALEIPYYIQPWDGYVPECTLKDQKLCKYFPVQTSNIKVNNIYEGIEVKSNKWMDLACEAAKNAVHCSGGPFGAVIVQIDDETNEVIRYWVQYNHVAKLKDPTAHAEVSVIRDACKSLGVNNLGIIKKSESRLPQKGATSHCEIYSSCEPCPMCYSAIFWARIPVLYFAATRFDAAQQGVDFSDEELYIDICKPYRNRKIKCYQCTTANSLDTFNLWKRTEHIKY